MARDVNGTGARSGAGTRIGQTLIVISVQILPQRNQKMSLPGKNVSSNIWGGSKVNFPHSTLNKISKFFAESPMN